MASRESKYVRAARIALSIARKSLPLYSHPKSPHHYTFPQLASCVLFLFYLNLSYREMEEWLLATNKVCQVLGLKKVPDHSTLCRAYFDIERMKRELLDSLEIREEIISVDSTLFPPEPGKCILRKQKW
jgi:hypothetical protein